MEGINEARELSDGFRRELSDGFRRELSDGFRRELSDGFRRDLADGFRRDLADGFRRDLADGFRRDLADGFRRDLSDGFRRGVCVPLVACTHLTLWRHLHSLLVRMKLHETLRTRNEEGATREGVSRSDRPDLLQSRLPCPQTILLFLSIHYPSPSPRPFHRLCTSLLRPLTVPLPRTPATLSNKHHWVTPPCGFL